MCEKLKILFKTRGGHREGMGDVTSSLALAEEFKNQGHDIFFMINNNKNVMNLVSQRAFKGTIAESIAEIGKALNQNTFDITILNQLNTSQDETMALKSHSKMLVTIEDTGIGAQLADLRFNILYPIDNSISDYKFIPLAHSFQNKHSIPKLIKEKVENILITQGGSDTYGFIPKIIKALYAIPADININVIIGPNFSHNIELNEMLDNAPRKFNLISGKHDLSDLMLESDLAISAGGNTLFELACLGVPTIVVCGEPFEVGTADRIEKKDFGINLGFGKYINETDIHSAVSSLMSDLTRRKAMSITGINLIDGHGIIEIIEKIKNAYNQKKSVIQK